MKKLLLFVLFTIMVLPIGVFAQEKVNVYVFRGDGCPHCEELMDYLEGLDSYDKTFRIYDYEVWSHDKYADMMDVIAEMRDEDASGVPYLIIGNKSWIGYSTDMNKEIEAQIDKVYNQDVSQRYDVLAEYEKNKDYYDRAEDEDYSDEDDYDDYEYESSCIDEDTMLGAALLAFIAGLGVAGVPLLIIIIVLIVVLVKNKRNG